MYMLLYLKMKSMMKMVQINSINILDITLSKQFGKMNIPFFTSPLILTSSLYLDDSHTGYYILKIVK